MQHKWKTHAALRDPSKPNASGIVAALGFIAISSPNLAMGSHHLEAAPGTSTALALSIALIGSLAVALVADSGISCIKHGITPASAISSLILLGYELLCRALEYLWLDWEYVSAQLPIGFVAQALRGMAAALLLAHLVLGIQDSAARNDRRGSRERMKPFIAFAPALLLACAGFIWYTSSEALHVETSIVDFDAIRATTLAGWCCTLLVYALVAWQARRAKAHTAKAQARWLATSSFFWGALLANMLLRIARIAGLSLTLPHEWYAVLACLVPAVCIGAAACMSLMGKPRTEVPGASETQPPTVEHQRVSTSSSAIDHALALLPGFEQLTEREAETVKLALSCRSMADVAEALDIAPSTATTYRSRALAKLGISSQDALVAILVSGSTAEASPERTSPAPSFPHRSIVLIALAPLLAAVALRILPVVAACVLIAMLALCTTLYGTIELVRDQGELDSSSVPTWHAIIGSMLIGSALAYATIALSQSSNVLDPLLSLGAIAASLHWAKRNPHLPDSCRALALISSSCIGMCCATIPALNFYPSEANSLLLLLVTVGIILLAGERHRGMERELAGAGGGADTEGNARPLSYLIGRGLNELESHVALLTARGYRASAIAATLSISPATVSSYRSRSYRKLDVSGKQELEELLRKEAGLHCGSAPHTI